MNLNTEAVKKNTYDAIVVGSGMSGGMAAKELTEKGLKVLVIERGREVKHVKDYDTMLKDPWEFQHRGKVPNKSAEELWSNSRFWGLANEEAAEFFTNDKENPFLEKRPFDWIRAYHTGGKSMQWGKQSYRWNRGDFEANLKEGIGVDWPVRYDDIAPWYSYAEKFVGVSGGKDGLDVLPDGEFQPEMPMYPPELLFKQKMMEKFNRPVVMGRAAHLTQPTAEQLALGRGSCQYRNKCSRGCPYGAYYSSLSGALAAAAKTNNLSLLNDTIVTELIYDDTKQKVTGVKVINQKTMHTEEFFGKIVFLNAGSMNTSALMLHSKSNRFANGFGNDSDQVGRNVMDHHLGSGASATVEGFEEDYVFGNRPNNIYIPRFRNWGSDKQKSFTRGYGYQGGASREGWGRGVNADGFGAAFKESLTHPGQWTFGFGGFGEVLPNPNNRMYLDDTQKDKWGIPLIVFDAAFGENELEQRKDIVKSGIEMLDAAGFKNINGYDNKQVHIGLGIHDMGTARMGRDPKTSVLNSYNQVHACKNVFVTDGAFMASSSCVNPSLTYMAFTARAADYAVSELKKQNLK